MAKSTEKSNETSEKKAPKLTGKSFRQALKIFRFILPYRGTFLLGNLFLVLSTVTALTTPYLAGKFLDVALGNTDAWFDSIYQVGYIFGAVLIMQALFSFFRIYLFATVSEKSMADIRQTLYSKILCLPISFFEQKRVGELNSRITSDVSQLQDVLSFTIAEFFRQIATILIGTTILLLQSAKLTLFMVATFPIMVIAAIIFGRFIRKLAKSSQDALANANIVVEETFQSVQAVKAFTNELFEIRRYRAALEEVVGKALKVAKYRGVFASFVIAILFGGIVLVLGFGAQLVENGEMLPGELTSFIIYTAFIGGAVGGTSELYGQVQKAVGASERILEILEEESEINPENPALGQEAPTHQPAEITFDAVHFAYPTRPDIEVLKGISFQIKRGEKAALVGHSGAGKSTIVQLISRYYPLKSGGITINGKDLETFDLTELRQHIGIVPQEVLLFGGTIRENIAYGKPSANEQEIIEAAQKANAWEFIQQFPEGLETIVGERGVKLSGGQRQRVAIARAILKDPSILILDEATSSLDADSEKLVQDALDELMKGRTTIIIAHRLATVRKADCIYVIDQGQIAESGKHETLALQEGGIYNNLVKLQFAEERMQG